MKSKTLTISILLIISIFTVYSCMNWGDTVAEERETLVRNAVVSDKDPLNAMNSAFYSDLAYNVDSRFMATITKEELHQATSVLDIVPKVAEGWWKVSFQTVTVATLQDGGETIVVGDEKTLNEDQIKLLQSTDYSSNFYIKARGTDKHPETGRIEDYVYYLTVIPEKEAEYTAGHDALIDYLKENSKEATSIVQQDKLQPGKVSFIITKEGTIANVQLNSTCGYRTVDETMIELIRNAPGQWKPAANSEGDQVDQELVFSYGVTGC